MTDDPEEPTHRAPREHRTDHPDADRRQDADDLVALLIPVIKAYGTDRGFENVSEAIQVCGGAGYTKDWSIEQYFRDLRIALIYEGTNHIQALDLVGRKLPMGKGRLLMTFQQRVQQAMEEAGEHEEIAALLPPFQKAVGRVMEATQKLASEGAKDQELAAAVASNYLNLFALTALGFMWLKMGFQRYTCAGIFDDHTVRRS